MRIAVANWSSRKVGGIESYVSIILPALCEAGHDVAFWHERDDPRDREELPVPPNVLTISAANGVDKAIASLRHWRPDVVYIQAVQNGEVERRLQDVAPSVFFLHTYLGTCISGRKMFANPISVPCDRQFGWPCLLHYFPHRCGGLSPITMVKEFQHQAGRLEILRRYTAVLTHTSHMQREMTRHGVAAGVIPYPVGVPEVREPQHDRSGWRLLFAGRMESLKGGSVLIDALPHIVRAAPEPVTLIFAGDGQERFRLEAQARKVVAETPRLNIEFRGWLSQDAVGAAMSEADLLVMPSLWPEPFGAVGPAAGQLGLPSAAFACGGIPDWLHDGINGHLAPADPPTPEGLARAVVQCLEDPAHYTSLRIGARAIADKYSMGYHLPALAQVFHQAIAS
jgi:glycosyltransferase involved in cell wall biosynthesis